MPEIVLCNVHIVPPDDSVTDEVPDKWVPSAVLRVNVSNVYTSTAPLVVVVLHMAGPESVAVSPDTANVRTHPARGAYWKPEPSGVNAAVAVRFCVLDIEPHVSVVVWEIDHGLPVNA